VEFSKHKYNELAPWQQSRDLIRKNIEESKYEWTKEYFKDMLNIHEEYPNILRRCSKKNTELRV